jgi:hypothetical protein
MSCHVMLQESSRFFVCVSIQVWKWTEDMLYMEKRTLDWKGRMSSFMLSWGLVSVSAILPFLCRQANDVHMSAHRNWRIYMYVYENFILERKKSFLIYIFEGCRTFLAYFQKLKVGLSNHQSVCLSPTNNFWTDQWIFVIFDRQVLPFKMTLTSQF